MNYTSISKINRSLMPALLALLCLFQSNCSMMKPLDPVTNKIKKVKSATDNSKYVVFKEQMVWANRKFYYDKDVLIYPGKYALEAEDSTYYYFRAPRGVNHGEYNYKTGKLTKSQIKPGGFCIKKAKFTISPFGDAGIYTSIDKETKNIVWILGANFISMKGDKWKTSY